MAARRNRPSRERIGRLPVEWCAWQQWWPEPKPGSAHQQSKKALALLAAFGLPVPVQRTS